MARTVTWEAKTLSVQASDTFHFLIHAAKLVSEDITNYWDFVGLCRVGSREENDRSWEQARSLYRR